MVVGPRSFSMAVGGAVLAVIRAVVAARLALGGAAARMVLRGRAPLVWCGFTTGRGSSGDSNACGGEPFALLPSYQSLPMLGW